VLHINKLKVNKNPDHRHGPGSSLNRNERVIGLQPVSRRRKEIEPDAPSA
jgi:hypothetical protein